MAHVRVRLKQLARPIGPLDLRDDAQTLCPLPQVKAVQKPMHELHMTLLRRRCVGQFGDRRDVI